MGVILISDVHDHIRNLDGVLEHLPASLPLLCLGDLSAPFVLARLARARSGPLHVVYGNNDGDRAHMASVAAGFDHVTMHGESFTGELGGLRVAASHYPEVARAFDPGRFDLIAYGHDHEAFAGMSGAARLVNPGAVMGYAPRRDLGDGADDGTVPVSWALADASGVTHLRLVAGGGAEVWTP